MFSDEDVINIIDKKYIFVLKFLFDDFSKEDQENAGQKEKD